jgi:hypothetical protein
MQRTTYGLDRIFLSFAMILLIYGRRGGEYFSMMNKSDG